MRRILITGSQGFSIFEYKDVEQTLISYCQEYFFNNYEIELVYNSAESAFYLIGNRFCRDYSCKSKVFSLYDSKILTMEEVQDKMLNYIGQARPIVFIFLNTNITSEITKLIDKATEKNYEVHVVEIIN